MYLAGESVRRFEPAPGVAVHYAEQVRPAALCLPGALPDRERVICEVPL